MKKIFLPLLMVLFVGLSSCTMTRKSIPTVPVNLQINLTMDNLEYVGEVTGTSTQSYVLGLPIGGRKNFTGVSEMQASSMIRVPQSRGMNNAMYDALKSKPDADFLIPLSYEVVKHQGFLGNKTILTLKAKAFKLKAK